MNKVIKCPATREKRGICTCGADGVKCSNSYNPDGTRIPVRKSLPYQGIARRNAATFTKLTNKFVFAIMERGSMQFLVSGMPYCFFKMTGFNEDAAHFTKSLADAALFKTQKEAQLRLDEIKMCQVANYPPEIEDTEWGDKVCVYSYIENPNLIVARVYWLWEDVTDG